MDLSRMDVKTVPGIPTGVAGDMRTEQEGSYVA